MCAWYVALALFPEEEVGSELICYPLQVLHITLRSFRGYDDAVTFARELRRKFTNVLFTKPPPETRRIPEQLQVGFGDEFARFVKEYPCREEEGNHVQIGASGTWHVSTACAGEWATACAAARVLPGTSWPLTEASVFVARMRKRRGADTEE